MKIGIFTECYKPVMNGVAVSVATFKKSLEEKGHEVYVFTPDHSDAEPEERVFRLPSISDPRHRLYPIAFPSVSLVKGKIPENVIRELDVIHSQHMFTAGRLARYFAKKFNKPLVYTYHTLISDYTHYLGMLAPITRIYLNNMSKRFCNTCDQIITPSNPMKDILLKYGVTKPIEIITTGIDPKAYKRISESASQQLKEKYNIPKDKKLLLYLSRIAKEKNIDFLFKAFKKILKEYPDCHLVMVGGGPEEEWCRNRIKDLGLRSQVTMTGMLPKDEANAMFGMADIFTFPSITETQGIVISEAMAAGTPPVAVGIMGPRDLIRDGEDGFLTKLNINDFKEKVLKLLKDDKLREQFAKNGLKRVEDFSTNTSVLKLIKLYNKVIDQHQKSLSGKEAVESIGD